MQEYVKKWDKVLEIVRDNVSKEQYELWFSPLSFLRVENGILYMHCPTEFFAEQLEARYIPLLGKAIVREFGPNIRIAYEYPVVSNDPTSNMAVGSAHPSSAVKPVPGAIRNPFDSRPIEEIESNLNPEYTFENYCRSDSNILAFSMAEAISNGTLTFNPLFIYGPSGVGKTHLIQALGVRIKERNPHARVLYVTARLFENQYTDAVLSKKVNEFMYFYQSIDTLIIDDVQDFIGKDSTQTTFFHIFNHLVLNNRKIIMSCDVSPLEMKGMMERMLTRFKQGGCAALERPDLKLRREVLDQKILRDGLQLPEEVKNFIASNVTQSIREIEGIVVSLLAHATFLNKEINIDLARRVVSNSVRLNKRTVNFESIAKSVCDHFGVSVDDIFTKSRKRDVSDARQMVMFLAKKHTKMPLKAIGARLGRTHATVLYACNTIEDRIGMDKKLQDNVCEIEKTIMA